MNSSGNVNQITNRSAKSNQNIQVYVRVRPLNFRERSMRSFEVVEVASPKEVIVKQLFESKTTKKFTFDRSFGPDSRQSEVYHTVVAPLIEEVLAGYNCTVFAYGQTGTGKTHTMIGTEVPELKSSWEDESMVGIIPRALSHLFDELRMMEVEFSMRISYLELYNEELCDLLSSDDSTKIRIFDDSTKKGSIIVQGLEEIPVHSKDDVYKLLEKGKERRKTAATLINAQSSRSHTVFSILVHIKENGMDGEEMLKIGKLNLVDLAGSENISKAGNEKGIRTRETVNINQSLLTLGRVITALVERTPHIPYRESKLTRLLQESLGGRTKTSIIATISPGHKDLEETLSTLEYAHRAKNIQNKPEINQKLTKKTVLKEYTEEIDRLKRDLMASRDKNGIYLTEETYNDMQYKLDSQNKELNEKMLLVKAMKDELASKEKIFNEVSLHLIEKSEELKRTEKNLTNTKSELDHTKKVLTKTKRKVEEKKKIVDSHVKTEKVLTEQATQIIEVADVATTDTHKLINTIERRKGVEMENISVCDAFVRKLVNLLDNQLQQHSNFTNEQYSHTQILGDEIGKSLSDHQKFASNLTNKTKTALKHCMESLNGIQSCREKFNEQFANVNSEHKVAFSAVLNEQKEECDNLKSHLEKYFAEMLELVNDQNRVVVSGCAKVVEIESNRNRILEDFSTQACIRLGQFKANMKSDWEKVIATITSAIEARQISSTRRKAFLEYVLKEMQSFEEEEIREKEKLQTLVDNSQEISCGAANVVDFEIKTIGVLVEETKQESVKDVVSEMDSARLGFVEKYSKSTEVAQNVLKDHNNKINATFSNSVELIDNHLKIIDGTLNEFKNNASAIEDLTKKQVSEESEETISLLAKETERVKLCQTQTGALKKSLQNRVNEYSTIYNNSIGECKESLQSFRESEIKTYIPTGQTPSRKEFSYPRILAATSPHANIIRRFRMEKEWSDADTTATTIAEDSELTLQDLSSDELGINSTPLNLEQSPEDLKLKEIKSDLNCHISQLNGIDGKSLSRKNSPALRFDKENKENCLT